MEDILRRARRALDQDPQDPRGFMRYREAQIRSGIMDPLVKRLEDLGVGWPEDVKHLDDKVKVNELICQHYGYPKMSSGLIMRTLELIARDDLNAVMSRGRAAKCHEYSRPVYGGTATLYVMKVTDKLRKAVEGSNQLPMDAETLIENFGALEMGRTDHIQNDQIFSVQWAPSSYGFAKDEEIVELWLYSMVVGSTLLNIGPPTTSGDAAPAHPDYDSDFHGPIE